jgi:hypothetical protein
MRKSKAFFDDLRDILDRSFDSMRSGVFRPTVNELDALESQLISEFSADASGGVSSSAVADFARILKALQGTRIALEEELAHMADSLRAQLRKQQK